MPRSLDLTGLNRGEELGQLERVSHSGRLAEELLHPPETVLLRGDSSQITSWARDLGKIYAPRRMVLAIPSDAPNLPPEEIRDNERLMPGEGVIDLQGALKALQTIGYQDALSVEVFGRHLKEMAPEEGAKLGLNSARAVLKKAGIRES